MGRKSVNKRVGRPTKYLPEMCDKVVELMSAGASKREVAAELRVSHEVMYDYCNRHPEFLEAIQEGELLSEAWWERHGRTNLCNKDFSATLWYMNMKNRFGWRDKVESSHTVYMKQEDALKELE